MRDLNYQLKLLCRRNRDGSHATQRDRERILSRIADQLQDLGFRGMNTRSLKPKHIEALVGQWQQEGLSAGTLKNRMAALRWWAQKVDRQNVIARSNEHYGIPDRQLVGHVSKAKTIDENGLDRIRDAHVRMSLELQRAFGLRREEAIKFSPGYADKGNHLVLKASWTKGGKERTIPVRTSEQRQVLDRVQHKSPRSKVIIITAYAMMAMARKAMEKGAFDFVPKPFVPNEMRAVVAKAAQSLGVELAVS